MAYFKTIEEFKGKIFKDIFIKEDGEGEDRISFTTNTNAVYNMYHEQNCCEEVYIESINGNIADLLNTPVILAEKITETGDNDNGWETYTWTFYKIGTIKGTVTIRWNGGSNGDYSEEVSIALRERD